MPAERSVPAQVTTEANRERNGTPFFPFEAYREFHGVEPWTGARLSVSFYALDYSDRLGPRARSRLEAVGFTFPPVKPPKRERKRDYEQEKRSREVRRLERAAEAAATPARKRALYDTDDEDPGFVETPAKRRAAIKALSKLAPERPDDDAAGAAAPAAGAAAAAPPPAFAPAALPPAFAPELPPAFPPEQAPPLTIPTWAPVPAAPPVPPAFAPELPPAFTTPTKRRPSRP